MSDFEEHCHQHDAVVEEKLSKDVHELGDLHNHAESVEAVDEPDIVEESDLPVHEEETRSRHSSHSSASNATEPAEEHHHNFVEQVEPKQHEPVIQFHNENQQNEENYENGNDDKPKVRPLVQPDFTQSQQAAKKDVDENDWAAKNQNCGKIKNLISMFDKGAVLNEKLGNSASTYKSDYGVGQSGKKIRQDVFH